MDTKRACEMLIRHEGIRLRMYVDSVGKRTIGVGHNLDDKPISPAACQMILADDLADAERDLRLLCGLRNVNLDALSEDRQLALIDLCFQLGPEGLGHFVRMWDAIREGKWDEAARQLLDSRYAAQVPERAHENGNLLR